MFRSQRLPPSVAALGWISLLAGLLSLTAPAGAADFDPEQAFRKMGKAVSVEGAIAHFSTGRLDSAYINAWNVGARVSLLPFGVIHYQKLLHGDLDGAFEVGLEPTFERFNSVHQNFAGVSLELRYYLVRMRYGPFVPWIGATIAPGYTDLDIGRVHDDNKLTGPFMNLIKGEVGVAYFIDNQRALYLGLEAQHISNASLNGNEGGNPTNFSINTPAGMVVGCSWFFP
jgi:Lipid A 3-O-deacylase (PagL)